MVLQHGFVSVLQRGEACHAAEEPTEETLGRDIQVIGYLLHREVGISQHHLYLCHHHIVNKFLGRTATHLLEVRLSSIPHAWVITHTPLHGASLYPTTNITKEPLFHFGHFQKNI